MGLESVVLFLYFIHLHSQGPVSVEVPVQGLLPLNSIWRCRISASHVPAHVPQLSHVVHAPSTVNDQYFIKLCQSNFSFRCLACQLILTFTGSCFSVCSSTWHVSTIEHEALSCICIAGAWACSPIVPSCPYPLNWKSLFGRRLESRY